MSAVDVDRLRRLLGGEDTAWLLDRLRRRLERGNSLSGIITRQGATDAERRAVARLLGRPPRPGRSVSVSLDEVERVLRRAGAAPDLRAAVEALTGRVTDVAAAGAAREAAWAAVLDEAEAWAERADLGEWAADLRRTGLLRRLAGGDPAAGRSLLDDMRRVVRSLPAGGVPRPRLAATVLGDSHALDDDRPLASLAIRAAARLAGADAAPGPEGETAWRRQVWAGVGVLVGELSAPALTLGLQAGPTSATGRLLATACEAGEALHLTLRLLVRDPPAWRVREVWVCENPTVVAAAADALGPRCAPLVCTNGQPSTAVSTLLRQFAHTGAVLRYHGDFDWPGIVMASAMVTRLGARPWRMGSADYLAACDRSTRPLAGSPVEAPWDAGLAPAMSERGLRVEEELVLDDLLTDLVSDEV